MVVFSNSYNVRFVNTENCSISVDYTGLTECNKIGLAKCGIWCIVPIKLVQKHIKNLSIPVYSSKQVTSHTVDAKYKQLRDFWPFATILANNAWKSDDSLKL